MKALLGAWMLAALVAVPTANAEEGGAWAPTRVASEYGFAPSVGMAGNGQGAIGWVDGGHDGALAAAISADGSVGEPARITTGNVGMPVITVAGDGAAYAVVSAYDRDFFGVSTRPPGGTFGPAQAVATASQPQIAANDAGEAVMAWVDRDSGDLLAAWRTPGGELGPPALVAPATQSFRLFMDRSGRAIVVRPHDEFLCSCSRAQPDIATGTAASGFTAPHEVWPGDPGLVFAGTDAAIDRDGDIVVAQTGYEDEPDQTPAIVRWGSSRDGVTFEAPHVRPLANRDGGLWDVAAATAPGAAEVLASNRGPLLRFASTGAADVADELAEGSSASLFSLATDSAGTLVGAFGRPGNGPDPAVLAFTRLPGSATSCAPERLSATDPAGPVSLAFDGNGHGLATWQQMRSSRILVAPYRAIAHCPAPRPAPALPPGTILEGPPPPPVSGRVAIGAVARATPDLRRARVPLRCTTAGTCAGALVLGHRATGFRLASHAKARVAIRLSPRVRRALRRHGSARVAIRAGANARKVLLRRSHR